MREYICLLPLKIPHAEIKTRECGCEVQLCPNPRCEHEELDSFGNHALSCHPGIGSKKATFLERSLERVFRKGGGRVERQPSTYRLLGEVFSKEDLMQLFPGKMSVPEGKLSRELALELVEALNLPPGPKKEIGRASCRERV